MGKMPKAKKREKKLEKEELREHKKAIMEWLKPYLETEADNEAEQTWNQLKLHGAAEEWDKFASVIREKWLATGHGIVQTSCLDSGQRCQTMWDVLKDIRGDTNTECGNTDGSTESSSANATVPDETNLGNVSSTSNVHGGAASNHPGTQNLNRFGKPKQKQEKTGGKQKKRKMELMSWFKPYMDSRPDSDAHRIWDELSFHAEAKDWKKFGGVIAKKYAQTHPGNKEATTCLMNSMHCRNIWDLLTGRANPADAMRYEPY